jgi:orotate phosphoribosyltransferase
MKLLSTEPFGKIYLKNKYFDSPEIIDALVSITRNAFFPPERKPYITKKGRTAQWAFDFRVALFEQTTRVFMPHLARYLSEQNYSTIGVRGYGAFPFIGLLQYPGINNILVVREKRKPYAFLKDIEGDADINSPVCLLEDLVNSGKSLMVAHQIFARNKYNVNKYVSFLNFGWNTNKKLNVSLLDTILELHR